MFRRLFSMMFGLGFGVVVGGAVVKQMEQAKQAVAPTTVAGNLAGQAGDVAARMRTAFAEARDAATAREDELRAQHAVPHPRDLVAAQQRTR